MDEPVSGSRQRPVFFADAHEFRAWLEEHQATATELWMGLRKKHVSPRGLTWDDAVPEALCFGWIDSVAQRIDDDATRQRWTPRRAGSTWSTVNIAHVERLEREGRMTPAGRAAFERRLEDKQGIYAYEQAETAALPAEYAARLAADARATAFWDKATPSYRKMAVYWVLSAKQEATRERRLAQLIECCAAAELIPPQRYGDPPSWVARVRAELGESRSPRLTP
ncbi:MAG TPA: YdeI/OmpD-associated family protein [Dermatophilaceae bacterium]|nr:YdeI/OmpD-associated family protein [Dermatophilaceae bacterium]